MKAILLAGGRGTRISRLIKEVPKCTLPIKDDLSLVRRSAEIFLKRNIKVIVCTGYKHELVEKALNGLDITYRYNPFYAVTNSIGTLWFAKDELDDDLIIMNADVYFDTKILDTLIASTHVVAMASDSSKCQTGDYFFKTNSNHHIVKYGKELPLEERTEEYVGIAKIGKSYVDKFKNKLIELVDNGQYNFWWENILYELADKGEKINAIDFAGLFWSEVDYYDEYLRIIDYINEHESDE